MKLVANKTVVSSAHILHNACIGDCFQITDIHNCVFVVMCCNYSDCSMHVVIASSIDDYKIGFVWTPFDLCDHLINGDYKIVALPNIELHTNL